MKIRATIEHYRKEVIELASNKDIDAKTYKELVVTYQFLELREIYKALVLPKAPQFRDVYVEKGNTIYEIELTTCDSKDSFKLDDLFRRLREQQNQYELSNGIYDIYYYNQTYPLNTVEEIFDLCKQAQQGHTHEIDNGHVCIKYIPLDMEFAEINPSMPAKFITPAPSIFEAIQTKSRKTYTSVKGSIKILIVYSHDSSKTIETKMYENEVKNFDQVWFLNVSANTLHKVI